MSVQLVVFGGFKVLPDYDIQSVPDGYEALILIGGMTWREENAQQIKVLVEDCYKKGKVLGGICDASAFLGTTCVLNNAAHTSNDIKDLKQWAGNAYTGEPDYICRQAVRDKNFIYKNLKKLLHFFTLYSILLFVRCC